MKTKRIIFVMMTATAFVAVSCSQGEKKPSEQSNSEPENTAVISGVKVDPAKSRVIWAGTMLGIYTHEGTVNFSQANLIMAEGKITGGNFTIDLNTIVPTDGNYNPEQGATPEKLTGHLKSADFFDAENYPTASFNITSVDGNSLKGMMTIKGITHEEKVENISMNRDGDKVSITGDMTIDRKKYEVKWDSPVKERVLSNDIKLKIELIGS